MFKNKSNLYFIIAFLAAGAIGIYFRLYPLIHFTPRDSSEKATLFVLMQMRKSITDNIDKQYPKIPESVREAFIQQKLDELIKKDNDRMRSAIKRVTESIDQDNTPKNSVPYLLASDSFYYYNLTENIINTGSISNTTRGSKYLNTLMLAPVGHWEPLNLHPYVGFFIYRILKTFNNAISLMYALSFTPIVISILSLIPFMFICKRFGLSPPVSFVSATYFLLAPIYMKRSTFGWYDNDPYNVLFPLLILTSLFSGFAPVKKTASLKHTLIYSCLSALLLMLYAFFWQGWALFFSVLLISGIIITIFKFIVRKEKSESRNMLIGWTAFFLCSFFLISIAFGLKEFFVLFQEGWTALKNFLSPQLSIWPDLYLSVGELNNASWKYIITFTGGKLFFGVAILGLVSSLIQVFKNPHHSNNIKTAILVVYLSISLLITFGAQRFVMLCLTPLALLFAIGLQTIIHYLTRLIDKFLDRIKMTKIPLKPSSLIMLVLMAYLSSLPIKSIAGTLPRILNPIFNEVWERALIQIDQRTPKNSIVNAWWPPGHFIKAIGKRRVTFDGASINYPQAYWLANMYLSTDEQQAVGYLRMLNTSANQAAEYLHEELGIDVSISVEILKRVTKTNKDKARRFLSVIIKDPKEIDHLLALTHGPTPPAYCLLFNEFVEKNLQLPFIGNWNFRKIEEINASPKLLKSIPEANSKEYIEFLWKLAGGPYKFSDPLTELGVEGDTIMLEHGLKINLSQKTATINSPTYGKGTPQSIFHLDGDTVKESKLVGAKLPYSILLYQKSQKYVAILIDRRLAQSMLVRLFYFQGKGLKYFKPFIYESDLSRRTEIYVFEIDWKRFEEDLKKDTVNQ